jgi:hypothetical protein
VADNQLEANLKWVLDIIRKEGEPISQRTLTRKTQKLNNKDRIDIVNSLVEGGDVIVTINKNSGAGAPSKFYTAITHNEVKSRLVGL